MKRAVVFDLDGVLVDGWHTRPQKRQAWNVTLREDLGIDPASMEKYFFHENGLFVRDVLSGKKSLHGALQEAICLCKGKCDAATFVDYWLSRDANMNAPMLEVVSRLKATGQVRLFIATNNEQTRMDYMWETVGLKDLFDDRFYASAFKVMKPEPSFFRKCGEKMGNVGCLPP